MQHRFHKTTVFNIDNNQKRVFRSAYYYDFCRSRDTEDCGNNDAGNSASRHMSKWDLTVYSHRYNCNISQFLQCFNQINAVWNDFFQKLKNLPDPKRLNGSVYVVQPLLLFKKYLF